LHGNLRNLKSETGAALVEFALISLMLILLLAGIIQTGLLISAKLSLENSAHLGARYAVLPFNANNDAAIKAYIINETDLGLAESDISIVPDTQRLSGTMVRVAINYNYRVPVTLGVFPETITLSATAAMMQN
jgi:Flp pilus assembly protein TadG